MRKKIINLAFILMIVVLLLVIFFIIKNKEEKEKNDNLNQESKNFFIKNAVSEDMLREKIVYQFSDSAALFLKKKSIIGEEFENFLLNEKISRQDIINSCYESFNKMKEKEKDVRYLSRQEYNLGVLEIQSDDELVIKRGLERLAKLCLFHNRVEGEVRSYALARLAEAHFFLPENYFEEAIWQNDNLIKESKYRRLLLTNYLKVENDFRKTMKNILNDSSEIGTNSLLILEVAYSKLEEIVQRGVDKNYSNDDLEVLRNILAVLKTKVDFKEPVLKSRLDVKKGEVSFSEWSLFYYYLFLTVLGNRFIEQPDLVNSIGGSFLPEKIENKEKIENIAKENLNLSQNLPWIKRDPIIFEHFARFYYAIFLNNAYGQSRADDIKKLLDPIYQMKGNNQRGIFVFLQKEKVYPDNYPHKKEILDLVKVDPRMKDMLLAAGWEME